MTSTDTPAGSLPALPAVIPAASVPSGSAIAERILDCFPSGSYALSALLRLLDIVETDTVPTAAVECRAQPRLLVDGAPAKRGHDLRCWRMPKKRGPDQRVPVM